ncbi:MAG: DUF559 domain-containing protein [Erysipelotrichaceae bacterium]|nr:DUF559 domain-containing protein [Erysipelotrichaceae bacterium]
MKKNLKEAFPAVVNGYWDYDKNLGARPEDFSPRSNIKVWWKCPNCGGSWETSIATRTRGSGCPYCAGTKVLAGFNDLATKRPDLLAEWDYDKNTDFNPTEVAQYANKNAFWKCEKGHSYLQKISSKAFQNQGCPYCAGKKVLKGFNDLASLHPELLDEWDYENNTINPDEIYAKSNTKVNWICKTCGRKWRASIYERTTGRGCKDCGNRRGAQARRNAILTTGGSLADRYPELLEEWDYKKNTITPYEVTASSTGRKVYWLCKKNHSYLMTPAARTNQKQGCPYCSGKRVLVGFNDLESNYPEIAVLWDKEKNGDLTPKDVLKGSHSRVWWKCFECGKSYEMSIYGRTKNKHLVCTACSKRISSGNKVKNMKAAGNTFAALEPDLAKEWHPTKNGVLTPNDFTRASSEKVWWLCPRCGNEWKKSIHLRSKGQGCPECAKAYRTSEPEQMVYYYVRKHFDDAVNSYRSDVLGRQEIDIYIPSLKLGIEYDGSRWHKSILKDLKKTEQLKSLGIDLVRIREKGCEELFDGSFIIVTEGGYKNYHELDKSISQLFDYINKKYNLSIEPDVDCQRDVGIVSEIMKSKMEKSSFAAVRPDLIEEWHPTKNGYLTPYNTVATSNRKRIWWKCSVCGYEWQAVPASRYARAEGHGCPNCARKKMSETAKKQFVPGVNDLATMRPDLVKEWDFEKNKRSPVEVAYKGRETAWWKCNKGHSFMQKVANRTGQNQGCPYCSGHKILPGFNDLATIKPELAKEWDFEKNGTRLPTMFTSKSHSMIYWKCHLCGYQWKDRIEDRFYGKKCPRCKGTGEYQESLFEDDSI